ncbi:hypothetical protein GO011_11550 [Mycobacterium sp. 20091114027_K0903767]|nr:hypothetical protein [Mycobacterium sp. 20091114027_K0903767]
MVSVTLIAGCSATVENPNYAECMARTPAPDRGYCEGMFPPRAARGVDGITAWIDQHIGALIVIGLAVIGIVIWRSMAKENAESRQKKESATLATGRLIAETWYDREVAKAQAEALASVPDRSVYDPAGVGLAPPPPPQPRYVPRPSMTPTDLKRYAAFNAVAAWTPGTAFASVTTAEGGIGPAVDAWNRACEAAGAGHTDANGTFTPIATVTRVFRTAGNRSAILAVQPRDVTIGEQELNRVREYFARLARVRTVLPFTRDHATGDFEALLSNDEVQQPAQAPSAPAQTTTAQADPDDPWS